MSSHLVFRLLLIPRYFSSKYSFQVEAAGRFTLQSWLLIWLSGAVTIFSPVSSLRFSRFFPVVVLALLPTSLATTATSWLGLSRRERKNLGYLLRICCLTVGSPDPRNPSTRKVWVLLGTSHDNLTHVFQLLFSLVSVQIPHHTSVEVTTIEFHSL